eukprot:COSAG01_NODE_19831_length_986_cov_3.655017_1_plen_80_part_01
MRGLLANTRYDDVPPYDWTRTPNPPYTTVLPSDDLPRDSGTNTGAPHPYTCRSGGCLRASAAASGQQGRGVSTTEARAAV